MPRFNKKGWGLLVLLLAFPLFNIGSAIIAFFLGVPVIRSTGPVSGSSGDVESGFYVTTDGCVEFPVAIADPDFYSNWTFRALARALGSPSYGRHPGLSRRDIVNGIKSVEPAEARFAEPPGKQRFDCSRRIPHHWQCVAAQYEWTTFRVWPNRAKSKVVYLYAGLQPRIAIVVDSESEEAIQFISL